MRSDRARRSRVERLQEARPEWLAVTEGDGEARPVVTLEVWWAGRWRSQAGEGAMLTASADRLGMKVPRGLRWASDRPRMPAATAVESERLVRGAEAGARQPCEVRASVPEWRSREVLVRPGVGCTTPPGSAAKPINRGARSGAAIRLRQLQPVVVHAGTTTVREPVRAAWSSGPGRAL